MKTNTSRRSALNSVLAERENQDAKWGLQNHDPFTYLTILVEEVGEFAQAALEARFGGPAAAGLKTEAIQTAAVALAIVECLERKEWQWPTIESCSVIDTEKALNYYRAAVESRRPDYVPARVMLLKRVRADMAFLYEDGKEYYAGPGEFDCESNPWGAISVRAANGKMLGVKPTEFRVLAWRPNAEVSQSAADDS